MTTRRGMLRGIAVAGAAVPFASLDLPGAQAATDLPASQAATGRGVSTGFEVLRAGGYQELRGQKVGMVATSMAAKPTV